MAAESAHVAVVLAAGGSRRLGRPKQLLRRNGETLLHRAARLARETGARRVLVVLGAQHETFTRSLRDLDVDVVVNPDWEQGLSTSLRSVARILSDDTGSVLLTACDQPALEVSHLMALLELAVSAASGCAATRHDGSLGIPAVVTPRVLQQALDLSGDRGLRGVLNAIDREAIGVWEAGELAVDVDSGEDVAIAQARGWLDSEVGLI